ncbi:GNAT family N-acetyltransferase [Gilvimarinus algae]|uniref:GNAT family N-acetyltransferase n=1 Tax=Gilvimarinus algae TaxID=3058037 RepID=A0ABT8TDI7_9GAMM|nr:GNAT family N-acetyltransferase [Gilvimarinus sp. SDUM040014]MDO3382145.1 GNAT family N-acetyltransferase [Gilvimarinus sp. SDUM040014]
MSSPDKANLHNLFTYWQALGAETSPGTSPPARQSTHWPRRIWLDLTEQLPEAAWILSAMERMGPGWLFPLWRSDSADGQHLLATLLDAGLGIALEQRAMYAKTTQLYPPPPEPSLDMSTAMSDEEIAIWTRTCAEAFGYPIQIQPIKRLSADPQARIQLARIEGEPAGTVVLYRTGSVLGVHSLGVTPAFRGQGLARRLMHFVIHQAMQSRDTMITLQASGMGLPLYKSLGFSEQFSITSLSL